MYSGCLENPSVIYEENCNIHYLLEHRCDYHTSFRVLFLFGLELQSEGLYLERSQFQRNFTFLDSLLFPIVLQNVTYPLPFRTNGALQCTSCPTSKTLIDPYNDAFTLSLGQLTT